MRVIAGKYRSRILVPIEGDNVRPTSDKVKESIFGSIQFDIAGSVFIDLFAGSGAMGIEALSRGADKVIFVDNARSSMAIIRQNLDKIVDRDDNYSLINNDYEVALKSLNTKADIIFVDAPYRDKPLANILKIVRDRDVLPSGGKIIYEHLLDDGESELIEGYEMLKRKKYGTIQVEVIGRV